MSQRIIDKLSQIRHCKRAAILFIYKLLTSSSLRQIRCTLFLLFQDASQFLRPLLQAFLQLRKISIKQNLGKGFDTLSQVLRDMIIFQQIFCSESFKPDRLFPVWVILSKAIAFLKQSSIVQCKHIINIFTNVIGKDHQMQFLQYRLFKDSFLPISKQARMLYKQGDLFLAEQVIELAIDVYHFFYQTGKLHYQEISMQNLYEMKSHLLQCQKNQKSLEFRIKALRINPRKTVTLHRVVVMPLSKLQEKNLYESLLQQIKKIYPNYSDYAAIYLIFNSKLTQKKVLHLQDWMIENHIEEETVPFYYHMKGFFELFNDQVTKGIQFFKKAQKVDRTDWLAKSMIGFCCYEMGYFKEAIKYGSSALKLQKWSYFQQQSKTRIALSYLASNRCREATEIYDSLMCLQKKGIHFEVETSIRLLMIESRLLKTNQALERAQSLLQQKLRESWYRIQIKIIQLINYVRLKQTQKFMQIIKDVADLAQKQLTNTNFASHMRFMTIFCYRFGFLQVGRLFVQHNMAQQLKQGYYERQVSTIELLNFMPL